MKALSIVLSVIAAILIALIAVFFIGGVLGTEASVTVMEATEDPVSLRRRRAGNRRWHAPLVLETLSEEELDGCRLANVTVTFTNNGLFAAEWLTYTLQGGEGDVAVYAQSADSLDIPARSSAQLNLKLLMRGNADGAGRALEVEYYVLGMRRTATISIE